MLFNSAQFLLGFLPIVLLVYYLLPHRAQNVFLVIASCVFYASWDWRFLLPLLVTTSLDYWVSRQLERTMHDGSSPAVRKRYVTLSVVANLGLLGFFKYFNFFIDSATALARQFGLDLPVRTFEIVLPVAISFYTFQALSYTLDVYRGQLHASRSFWDFFLGVLYFPHLVAGPIQRAASLLPQVVNPRRITRAQVLEGLHLIVWGFFKKVYIADNLAPIADAVFANPSPSGGEAIVGILAFTFQIYCDFSGYTDIARGLAKIMGFEFVLNFNLPYFATNPSDFWRRWHISLSTWLRDYLYKSLGGSREGTFKTYRNLMLTMLLGGLWHGAAWNFVLWGFYHGAILVLHRLFSPALARLGRGFASAPWLWTTLCIMGMFVLTCYGWLLFRAISLHQIAQMTIALADPLAGLDIGLLKKILLIISPLIVVQLVQWFSGELFFTRLSWIPVPAKLVIYTLMLYMTIFLGGEPQAFVYFQF